MRSVSMSGAGAPPPIFLQADRVKRRITASESVAALVAELAFGATRRGDLGALAAITATRVASHQGGR